MNKLTLALLFAASFAVAQTYTYSFTAPAGAFSCAHGNSPQFYIEFYSYLIENSTPPYPNGVTVNTVSGPRTFFAPPAPNTPIPTCEYLNGFVSSTGVTANLQLGSTIGWLRTSAGQAIELQNPHWLLPPSYPDLGQPTTFAMDATITAVCAAICQNATGDLHLQGPWASSWQTFSVSGGRTGGVWHYIKKVFTNTDQVVITGQSTVAILD